MSKETAKEVWKEVHPSEVGTKKRGLIAGYEPNRLSLYIILINADRIDELNDVLWKDMEKYKIKED